MKIRNFDISKMVGLTALDVKASCDYKDGDNNVMQFTFEEIKVKFFHMQSCCEGVWIESIVGDLNDLIGSPLLVAEEVSSETTLDNDKEIETRWTFYKFDTAKGGVTVRWYGESNGYYSTAVDIEAETDEN